jgi:hypothetical protein
MYCPACGSQSHETQKYCRSCGMVLEGISEAVVEHLASISNHSLTEATSRKKRLIKKSERMGELMGMGGILLLFTFLTVFFISLGLSKLLGLNLEVFNLLGPLAMSITLPLIFVGAGLRLYPMLSKLLSGSKGEHLSALSQADTARELLSNHSIESMPSVTERTTRTLEHSTSKTPGPHS